MVVHSHLELTDQSWGRYLLGLNYLKTNINGMKGSPYRNDPLYEMPCKPVEVPHSNLNLVYSSSHLTHHPTQHRCSCLLGSLFPLSSRHAVPSAWNTWAKLLLHCNSAQMSLLQEFSKFSMPFFTTSLPRRVSSSFSFLM